MILTKKLTVGVITAILTAGCSNTIVARKPDRRWADMYVVRQEGSDSLRVQVLVQNICDEPYSPYQDDARMFGRSGSYYVSPPEWYSGGPRDLYGARVTIFVRDDSLVSYVDSTGRTAFPAEARDFDAVEVKAGWFDPIRLVPASRGTLGIIFIIREPHWPDACSITSSELPFKAA